MKRKYIQISDNSNILYCTYNYLFNYPIKNIPKYVKIDDNRVSDYLSQDSLCDINLDDIIMEYLFYGNNNYRIKLYNTKEYFIYNIEDINVGDIKVNMISNQSILLDDINYITYNNNKYEIDSIYYNKESNIYEIFMKNPWDKYIKRNSKFLIKNYGDSINNYIYDQTSKYMIFLIFNIDTLNSRIINKNDMLFEYNNFIYSNIDFIFDSSTRIQNLNIFNIYKDKYLDLNNYLYDILNGSIFIYNNISEINGDAYSSNYSFITSNKTGNINILLKNNSKINLVLNSLLLFNKIFLYNIERKGLFLFELNGEISFGKELIEVPIKYKMIKKENELYSSNKLIGQMGELFSEMDFFDEEVVLINDKSIAIPILDIKFIPIIFNQDNGIFDEFITITNYK